MDGRFSIFEGFGEQVNVIFNKFIEKYNLTYSKESDSGVSFENEKFILNVFFETSIQINYFDKAKHSNEMFLYICKDYNVEEIFWAIMKYTSVTNNSVRSLKALSEFLCLNCFEPLFLKNGKQC